jgi:hypothetical protein
MINSTIKFNTLWGDAPSNERLRKSHKGLDVQKAESENYLKDMALRFERSPNQTTLKLWASDLIDSGFQDWQVKEVCRAIPYKFEKHPTLNQIIELLNPYRAKAAVLTDELTDLSHRCYFHLKAKFLTFASQEQLTQMCKVYAREIYPDLLSYNAYYQEMCVLNDWLRTYFKKGDDVLKQGLLSNEQANAKNKDYFINSLKRYAKEHGL